MIKKMYQYSYKDMRLNKALAILGICSRRQADQLISQGKVFVNGQKAALGMNIKSIDIICVNGQNYTFPKNFEPKIWIYHKPVGLITTHLDPQGRPTVFDDIEKKLGERVISVGRLDLNSQGLLLLTNSGEFANYAENPKTGWERVYLVRVFGDLNKNIIDSISKGVIIEGFTYAPMRIDIVRSNGAKNTWIKCILKEGKNREIRRIFNHFGVQVNKLIRIKYGPFALGNLKAGELKQVWR